MAQQLDSRRSEFQSVVEPWFAERGVPYFCPSYTPRRRASELVPLLFTVLGFEVAIAPWLDLSVLSLVLALAVVLFLALCLPLPRAHGRDSSASLFWLVARLVPLGVIGSLLASDSPPLWSDDWVDAAVLLVGLAASALLFQDEVWRGNGSDVAARRRTQLIVLILAGVVVFAFDGRVAPLDYSLSTMVGDVFPFVSPVPQALPALILLVLVYVWSRDLVAASSDGGGTTETRDPTAAALVTAMPLLVILVGAETTVLPDVASDPTLGALLPLALTVVLATCGAFAFLRANHAAARTQAGSRSARLKEVVADRDVSTHRGALLAWLALFLVSYPLLTLFHLELDAFGTRLSGGLAFLATLAINVLYLAVAWFLVSFGLVRIAVWARTERAPISESVAVGLVRGLPLLLVFTVFFALTAETWEIAIEAGNAGYVGLLAVLAGLTAIFMLVTSALELRKHCRFNTATALKQAALRTKDPGSEPPDLPFVPVLKELTDQHAPSVARQPLKLRGRQWINAMAVLCAYQAFVFIPVTVLAGVLFWVLGTLAVPSDVAATWIYGDGASAKRAAELTSRGFIDEPWPRVALLLAVFSTLYLAVTVQSTKEHRDEFFVGAERMIRQLFAVKLVYDRFLSGELAASKPPRKLSA